MLMTDELVAELSVWMRGSCTGMTLPAFTNSGILSIGASTVTDLQIGLWNEKDPVVILLPMQTFHCCYAYPPPP